MSGGLLSFFWDLAGDAQTRQQAVANLLAQLEGEQKEYTENREDGDGEALCSNLAYSVKRLVRGLASSRAGARQGFSLALTRILVTFPVVETKAVMSLIKKHIANSSTHNKQERRDYYVGRIFSILVLLRSSRLGDVSNQELSRTVTQLLDFCSTLALREISFKTISSLVKETSFERVQQAVWPVLATQFDNKDSELTPEHVALAVTLQRKYKANNLKSPSATVRRVLSSSHFSELTAPLKEAARCHPRTHFVWDTLLQELFKKDKWAPLWTTCIDGLFVSTAFSHQYLGFQLFDLIMRHISQHPSDNAFEQMAPLFSANFLKCCKHHLNSKMRLYKCATHTTRKVLVECAGRDSKVAFAIVNHLVIGGNGKPFDEETYKRLLTKLNDADVETHVEALNASFSSALTELTENKDEEKEAALLKTCKSALEQLFAVARFRASYTKHLSSFLQLLMQYAFFEHDDESVVPEQLSTICAARFNTLVSDLTKPLTKPPARDEKDNKENKEKTVVWVLKLHDTWTRLLDSGFTPRSDPEGEHENLRKDMLKATKALNKKRKGKKDGEQKQQKHALKVLMPYLGLLMLEEPDEMAPMVQDVIECSKALTKAKSGNKHIPVLLDIILALLSRPSTVLRSVANSVFRAFSGDLNKDAIMTLLRALEIQANNGEEDEEDEGLFEMAEADEKQIAASTSAAMEANSDSDSDSDDDESGQLPFTKAMEDDEEEITDFEQLANVLMGNNLGEDEMRENIALAGLAGLKKKKKQDQADLERQTHHFKLRVLDLVATYIQKQDSSRHILLFITPLVNGMSGNRGGKKQGGSKQQFLNRLQSLICNKLCKSSPDVTPNDGPELLELLNGFFARSHKTVKKEMQQVLGKAILFCVKLLLRLAEKQKLINAQDNLTPKVLKSMREALKRYISVKHSAIGQRFFVDIFKRYPAMAWRLLPFMAKLVSSGKFANAYCLHEAWLLMGRIMGSRALLKSDPAIRDLFLEAVPGVTLALSNSIKALGQIPTQSEEAPKWGRFAKYIRVVLKTFCSFRVLVHRTMATEEAKESPQVFTPAVKSSVECLPAPLTELLTPALINFYTVANWDIPSSWAAAKKGGRKKKSGQNNAPKSQQQKRKRGAGSQGKGGQKKKPKTGEANGNSAGAGKTKKKLNGRARANQKRMKMEAKRKAAKAARVANGGSVISSKRKAPGKSVQTTTPQPQPQPQSQPTKKAKTNTKKKSTKQKKKKKKTST